MNKKGQVAVNAIGLVVFAIVIIVGAIVFSELDDTASSLSSTTAGTAVLANVTTNTYSSFNIVAIGPIVLAAVVILGVVGLLARR